MGIPRWCCSCFVVFNLILAAMVVESQDAGLYNTSSTCPTSSFYSSVRLNCAACPANQTTSGNGLSCECDRGLFKVAGSGVTDFNCERCRDNQVVSRDGLFCLVCMGGTTFDPSTSQCSRCSGLTQSYEDTLPSSQSAVGVRSCVSCPAGTWSSSDGFSCVECGIADCTQCTVVQGVCFSPTTEPVQGQVTATYSFYTGNFMAAVQQCRDASNTSACQLVANLCVLQLYLRSDAACEQTLVFSTQGLLQSLYYPERGAQMVLGETAVRATLFTKNSSSLPLVVASYSLNGTFLELENLLDQQILLCKDRPSRGAAFVRVGVDYSISCSVSVSELTRRGDAPVFYEVFFLNQAADTTRISELLPVPILVTNYRTPQGEGVNTGGNVGRWQLVRRFFLAETVSSQPQYVQNMQLVVNVGEGGQLSLPYLRVSYNPWTPGLTSSQTVHSSYETVYGFSSQPLLIGLSIAAGLLLAASVVYAAIKTNGYIRRAGSLFCEVNAYLYLVMELCSAASSLLFLLLTAASLFFLVVFKGQTVLFFVLPTGQQELIFEAFLGLALVFRVFQVVYLMWTQCTVDIFFMDWERSRGVLVNRNLTSVPKGARPDSVPTPVSIWRTYFVANEWNEIQSSRSINHRLLLVIVLLFLQVVGFDHLAERDPESHVTASVDRYSAPPSDILRFGITALTFIIVAVIMRLYLFLIYERYVEHKIRQFTDLCSVSNVSVLIMPSKLHGYYIHGRSVHGHADTNMREMNYNLLKEEEGLCGERGLESGSDLQTYQLSLTNQFRTQYDTIYSPLRARWAEGGGVVTTELGRGGTPLHKGRNPDTGRGLSESTIVAYEAMNQFLTQFFERSLQQMSFVVKDKLLAERVLKMEFNSATDSSIIFRDSGMNFEHVLFRGHGWTLFQLDLLVFAMVDLIARNYVLSAIIAFIVTWSLDYLRDAFGRRNLAKKTLVDNRFLI